MPAEKAPRARRGLRVIGGSVRGRRLRVPPGRDVRPTRDRIRESLFSILGNTVEGCVVLDAFAGSGTLGIEALSRGARRAVFCDIRLECIHAVQENLKRCGLIERALVLREEVPEGLSRLRKAMGEPFNLVFLDPPYGEEGFEHLLSTFHRFALLKERARIVCEHSRRIPFPCVPDGFVIEQRRRYGDSALTFLRYQPGESRDDGR